MPKKIDTTAEINNLYFKEQGGNPAAPSSGYVSLFVKSNNLYFIDSSGYVFGPFVTGSSINYPYIAWATGTVTSGVSANRTTGGTFNRQTGKYIFARPTKIYSIDVDVLVTGSYSLSISSDGDALIDIYSIDIPQTALSGSSTLSFVPDGGYLILTPGTYYFTVRYTNTNAILWRDSNTALPVSTILYAIPIMYYNTTSNTTYTPPFKITATYGDWINE